MIHMVQNSLIPYLEHLDKLTEGKGGREVRKLPATIGSSQTSHWNPCMASRRVSFAFCLCLSLFSVDLQLNGAARSTFVAWFFDVKSWRINGTLPSHRLALTSPTPGIPMEVGFTIR